MSVSLTHAFTSGISDGSTAYTGTFTSGTNTITSVNPTPPATGAVGFKLFGGPVATGATIASVSGNTITMSANATGTSAGATFYSGDGQVQPSDWNAQHTLSLAQGNILGRTAAAGTGAAIEIPLSFDASNNATFPGQVNLAAGTTTIAPLDFVSGTNLTTANAGAMEYDGKKLMFTPQGTQRGVVPGMQYYQLNSTLALSASTAAQAWLGVGCTLSSNTVYSFEAMWPVIKTTTTTAHVAGTSFGGTATLNNIGYWQVVYFDTTGFTAVSSTPRAGWINTAANTTTMGSSTSATNYQVWYFRGYVSVATGGTFIPQVTLSASGPIYTGQIGSWFSIYPVGTAGANVNVGTWA